MILVNPSEMQGVRRHCSPPVQNVHYQVHFPFQGVNTRTVSWRLIRSRRLPFSAVSVLHGGWGKDIDNLFWGDSYYKQDEARGFLGHPDLFSHGARAIRMWGMFVRIDYAKSRMK